MSDKSAIGDLKVAVAQFHGSTNWEDNLETCRKYMQRAKAKGINLLVLPEAVLQTLDKDTSDYPRESQPIDGPFISGLVETSRGASALTTVLGTTEATDDPRPTNTVVAISDGEVKYVYRKLHLYDAYATQESEFNAPGNETPAVFECQGFKIGVMTCYDIRFPEVARVLADSGADILVVPTAWIPGALKEMHWDVLTSARAMENTCYLIGAGKTGPGRIGCSVIVDPEGVKRAQLGPTESWATAVVDQDLIADVRKRLPLLKQRRFAIDPVPLPAPTIN